MSAPSPEPRVVRYFERFMKCASCRADARWMIFRPGSDHAFGTTSCERHRALWVRRLAEPERAG